MFYLNTFNFTQSIHNYIIMHMNILSIMKNAIQSLSIHVFLKLQSIDLNKLYALTIWLEISAAKTTETSKEEKPKNDDILNEVLDETPINKQAY